MKPTPDELEARADEILNEAKAVQRQPRHEKWRETPDYCYDTNDWEHTYEWPSRNDLTDGYDPHQVIEVACLKELPHQYAVALCIEYSDEGDPEDWETFWFDNEDAANRAIEADTYDNWLVECERQSGDHW